MTNATIAVVGAGIVGCLIARELTVRAPGTSVVVLDRDAVGSGASRRSAGLHFPRGATARVRRMTGYSQDYYESMKANDPSLPIHPLGMFVVASRWPATYLDSAELHPVPGLPGDLVRVGEDAGIWRGDHCQYADVPALAQALAHELRPRVTIREGVEVTAVEPGTAEVVLRLSTGETLTAGHVVLAPGPWLACSAWRALVAPMGARVKKVAALHVEHKAGEHDSAIIFEDEDAFLLPLRHRGHWLFSYTCQEWDVDPDTVPRGLSKRDFEEAQASLRRYSPVLAARAGAGRVFCDAYSAAREPEIRALDAAGRVVFAGAANGSGYRLAPAIAAAATDLLNLPCREPGRPVDEMSQT